MLTFSVWHWVIVFILGAVVAYTVWTSYKCPKDKTPQSIGGWLVLLAFVQIIGLMRSIGVDVTQFWHYGPVMALPGGRAAVYGEIFLNAALIGLMVVTTWALLTKRRAFPTLFFCQWLALPTHYIINAVVISSCLDVSIFDYPDENDINLIIVFIISGILVWCIQKSTRVKNTLVNA